MAPTGTLPPNMVFVFADDWGRYASAYAKHEVSGPGGKLNDVIRTPHFDRIASEGALFLNALVPAPSCTPCRSSMLSGQYFWQTGLGAILEGAKWDESIPTFPLELEKHGYFIGHTYKVWAPGKTANAPIGGKRTRYQSAGNNFAHFSHWVTEHAPELGVEGAKDACFREARANMKEFLGARPAGKPFFYFFGPANTHRTWERGSGKALWGLDPDMLKGRLPAFLPDVHDVREDVADYLGECLAVDHCIGMLFEELEAMGELDNTLVAASGDHGIPGMPRAKCNLYDIGCEVALAVRWPGKITPGRVVNDFVNLMDLAPTFLEASGLAPVPATMKGKSRSLLPILLSQQPTGQVEPERDFVVTGRERHISMANRLRPYPQRSLRTKDFIYIVNFEPDRYPAGEPNGVDDGSTPTPDYFSLAYKSSTCFIDMDASPTKAYMVLHREDLDVEPLYQLGFGKRPREELYDLGKDPDYMQNIATAPAYEEVRKAMESRLMRILREQGDPRLVEEPCRFELEPYASAGVWTTTVSLDDAERPWKERYEAWAQAYESMTIGGFGGSNQTTPPTPAQREGNLKAFERAKASLIAEGRMSKL